MLPIVFQGFWLGVPLIFSKSTLSFHVLSWLPSLPRLLSARVGGPVAVEDTRRMSLPECLSRRHLR
jgi:hypothetical protein